MSLEPIFLKFSADKLDQLCGRIEACVDKLTPDQIWTRRAENENAIGNLMLHLAGNVRQWILHGVGDQPDLRQRDTEFAASAGDSGELKKRLRSTVDEAVALLRSLPAERLGERRNIQKHYDVTVLEAIYHVVEHFSGHTGQIIFATKLLTGDDMGFYLYLGNPRTQEKKQP